MKNRLFVINDDLFVTDSILSRGEVSPFEQQTVVGQVMDQGLAGWDWLHQCPRSSGPLGLMQ